MDGLRPALLAEAGDKLLLAILGALSLAPPRSAFCCKYACTSAMTSGRRASDFFVSPGIQPLTYSCVINVTLVDGGFVCNGFKIQP